MDVGEHREWVALAECVGVALAETLRCGMDATRDTGNLREGWRNAATRIIALAERGVDG